MARRRRWPSASVAHTAVAISLAPLLVEVQAQDLSSYGWLALDRAEYCKTAATQPPQLDETSSYPAQAYDTQPNAGTRVLIQEFRKDNGLVPVVRACPLWSSDARDNNDCTNQLQEYITGMAMYAIPLVAGVLSLFLWLTCCFVAGCRSCRRCCLCSERKAPRPAALWQKCTVAMFAFICTCAILGACIAAFQSSGGANSGVSNMLCYLLVQSDEILNGSPLNPLFLGTDASYGRISMVRRLLDVDGRAMTDVRAILDETATFATAMDTLVVKIEHMKRVLTLVGHAKVKEHSCWFCQNAVGNNATGEIGLLNELLVTIQQSSADAMRSIQKATESALTGKSLVDVSTAVARGGVALETFRRGFVGTWIDSLGSWVAFVKTVEDARHTVFQAMCVFCVAHALLVSNIAVWRTKRSKAKYPSGAPSLVTWSCGFCGITLALLSAGACVLFAIPLSEACDFWRYDLLTYEGVNDYYLQVGLADPTHYLHAADPISVDVWRTCLTPNGTGDALTALRLRQKLDFQRILFNGFVTLEDKMAGAVFDIAKFELLVSQASRFGGLFVLDPDVPLALAPDAASKMLGSSVDADDAEGPDGESLIYGLNTYASLIAGAGQYSFEHGTAGGGTLITSVSPTEEEVSNLDAVTQHALAYARLKEQLLTERNIFRCDVLDAQLQVTERQCSYQQFKATVLDYATQIRAAGVTLDQEAAKARELIASTTSTTSLRSSLEPLLAEVKALRENFNCRFMWRRWEDFDLALCNRALPGVLECAAAWMAVACFELFLTVVHYKMWRHLLDNRVVGEELERFSKKYGYLSIKA